MQTGVDSLKTYLENASISYGDQTTFKIHNLTQSKTGKNVFCLVPWADQLFRVFLISASLSKAINLYIFFIRSY